VNEPDDPEVIREALQGNQQAFAVLVTHHYDGVYRWLRHLTAQTHLAEDLTQEAFLRAWNGRATFRDGADFRTWLFGIARHAHIDRVRRHRQVVQQPLGDDLASRQPGPAETVLEREAAACLADACARLPELLRASFLLWSQEQLSFAQIGEVFGVPEGTARWRVFRARQLLIEYLGNYLDQKK
jgi:RNA polymerase sigma-70 factor (ECF subfamily)